MDACEEGRDEDDAEENCGVADELELSWVEGCE